MRRAAAAHTLRKEDSRETLTQWTSLADVQIFTLITSEFGIEPDGELIEADTVDDLLRVLDSRGAFRERCSMLNQAKMGVLRLAEASGASHLLSGSPLAAESLTNPLLSRHFQVQ